MTAALDLPDLKTVLLDSIDGADSSPDAVRLFADRLVSFTKQLGRVADALKGKNPPRLRVQGGRLVFTGDDLDRLKKTGLVTVDE